LKLSPYSFGDPYCYDAVIEFFIHFHIFVIDEMCLENKSVINGKISTYSFKERE